MADGILRGDRDSPDGVVVGGGQIRRMQIESVDGATPFAREFEETQQKEDIHACGDTVGHSEVLINTSPDSENLESLGFSIKTKLFRGNTFHYIHPSDALDAPIPAPLRRGDQIIKIYTREKAETNNVLKTLDVIGISSHQNTLNFFEQMNSNHHAFSMIIRRVENGKGVFYEVIFKVVKEEATIDGEVVRISVMEVMTNRMKPIPGTNLYVKNDTAMIEEVNIQLGVPRAGVKHWVVIENKSRIKFAPASNKFNLAIERLSYQCFDGDTLNNVSVSVFGRHKTNKYVEVVEESGALKIQIGKHNEKPLLKETMFKEASVEDSTLSTLESVRAPGYFLAAAPDNTITLAPESEEKIITRKFQILFAGRVGTNHIETIKPQVNASQTTTGRSTFSEWLDRFLRRLKIRK